MSLFALIHGSSSDPRYWDLVTPRLRAAGHDVVAPALPTTDDAATFETYADAVLSVIPSGPELVVVGHSMGAFTAPVVASQVPTSRLVLTAPMIPLPGETPMAWFDHVGLTEAQRRYAEAEGFDPAFDLQRTFFHDVPSEVVERLMAGGEPPQSATVFDAPCPIVRWPDVPTVVLACRQDRMFPLELQRRVAMDRLGVEPDEMDSGHLPGFGHPAELADRLLAYAPGGVSR